MDACFLSIAIVMCQNALTLSFDSLGSSLFSQLSDSENENAAKELNHVFAVD